ncbi:MAG: 4-hydroxy-3-methylbut-2-enyl diphosphate reductase [Lachnospiraceae bacterium]|nr:4-hydroxy-3-methylbut-2-enyl diphosphate reductase [Lachnospiraceae bacterium]
MKVRLAEKAGFCFGVKRAVDMVYSECEQDTQVYTYGSIIHNEEVVKDLEDKGVIVINTKEELKTIESGTVIIRSHGVEKEVYDIFEGKDVKLVDATCPFVKKIHGIVRDNSLDNRDIVIVGNSSHPEVQGIKGWCLSKTHIIEDIIDVNDLEINNDRICVVSQTTFNHKKYGEIIEAIYSRFNKSDIIDVNTICNATEERQKETVKLAKESDVMIVIGGKNSSNTQKLYAICSEECNNTFYIQKSSDLKLDEIDSEAKVGITAGASTPNTIIKEVFNQCQK